MNQSQGRCQDAPVHPFNLPGGNYVIARPSGMAYSVERATKSLLGSMTSGEGYVRVYQGTGTVLMAPIPYWRQRLYASLSSLTQPRTAK